jgi:hypothetical protein
MSNKTQAQILREWMDKLSEAPLADYQTMGDFNKSYAYGLTDVDKKLAQHPVQLKKLHDFFNKCPVDFRIFVVNGEHISSQYYREQGVNPDDLKEMGFADDQITKIFASTTQSITAVIISTDNDPYTPWLTAHRLVHAYDDDSRYDGPITQSVKVKLAEYGLELDDLMTMMTTKSFRTGKIIDGVEAVREMLPEYILRGKIVIQSGGKVDENGAADLSNTFTTIMANVLKNMIGKAYLLAGNVDY